MAKWLTCCASLDTHVMYSDSESDVQRTISLSLQCWQEDSEGLHTGVAQCLLCVGIDSPLTNLLKFGLKLQMTFGVSDSNSIEWAIWRFSSRARVFECLLTRSVLIRQVQAAVDSASPKNLSSTRSLPVSIVERLGRSSDSLVFLGRSLLVSFDYTVKSSQSHR